MEDKILNEGLLITYAFVPEEKVQKYLKKIDPKYLLTEEEIRDNFSDQPEVQINLLKNGYVSSTVFGGTRVSGIPVKVTSDLLFKSVEDLYVQRKPRQKRVAKGI